nr:MAG TPA: hypothetical protein [Caudoviricetes sp.]
MKVKINYSAVVEIPDTEKYSKVIENIRNSIKNDKEELCKEVDEIFYDNDLDIKFESNFDMVID